MGLFESAYEDTDAETVRLLGLTAARLGRSDQALSAARRLRDLPAVSGRNPSGDVEAIVTGLLDRLEDAALDSAIEVAAADDLVELSVVRSYRAQAAASRGQFEEAVEALGLDPGKIAQASPTDQVRCATAYLVGARYADAYPLLHPNIDALSIPDGQLFLARAALARRDTTTARQALRRVCEGEEPAAEVARVALDLVTAIETSPRDALAHIQFAIPDPQPSRVVDLRWAMAGPESQWEGPQQRDGEPVHDAASPVLDRFASVWATDLTGAWVTH